jgi:hypothetical protein
MYTGTLAAVSNKEDWKFTISLVDPETSDVVDLTGSTVKLTVREQNTKQAVLSAVPQLTARSRSAIRPEANVWSGSRLPTWRSLPAAGTFDVGITVLLSTGMTYQLIAGQLPVIDGIIE